jgi:hypothetical protein
MRADIPPLRGEPSNARARIELGGVDGIVGGAGIAKDLETESQIASAGVDDRFERSADVVPLEVGQLQEGGLSLPDDLDRVRDLLRQSPRARHLLVSPEDGQMQSQLCGLTRFERNRMPLVDL